MATLVETTDIDSFNSEAIEQIASRITSTISSRDHCIVGLSGGSTPKPIYTALGQREDIDWSKVSIFLVDDRYVPFSHPDSNAGMVQSTLLAGASIPAENIVLADTTLPMEECLVQWSFDLQSQWADHLPDVLILGMGPDGHITSLFPPVAEDLLDDTRLVAHTTTERFAIFDRLTVTLNPLRNANSCILLLKGQDKKDTYEDMMGSNEGPQRWPMKAVMEDIDDTVVVGCW